MGWLMGIEPMYAGITIRCVNHFAIATMRRSRHLTQSQFLVNGKLDFYWSFVRRPFSTRNDIVCSGLQSSPLSDTLTIKSKDAPCSVASSK